MNKKKQQQIFLIAALVVMLNFTACKKYPEGPLISLKSKTARLSGEWEVVDIEGGGLDPDADLILEFDKDGNFNFTYDYGSYSYSYDGEWEWKDGKEELQMDFDGNTTDWKVVRLTDKEFWFEDEDGDQWDCEKK